MIKSIYLYFKLVPRKKYKFMQKAFKFKMLRIERAAHAVH
jgi:hypothetical protein